MIGSNDSSAWWEFPVKFIITMSNFLIHLKTFGLTSSPVFIPTRRCDVGADLNLVNCTESDPCLCVCVCVSACIDVEAHIAPLNWHMLPSRQRLIWGALTEAGQWRASSSTLSQTEPARLKRLACSQTCPLLEICSRYEDEEETTKIWDVWASEGWPKWTRIPLETFKDSTFGDNWERRLKERAGGVSCVLPSVY